ncbi:hypothetical protein I203_106202 [Kwoniella mangroviensis CBS 8507]|uniref:uncharacterized protein n=1 Tax=Kwoniella mangroviensis CBS 8507 TaxID=1296122 RepID=UPI003032155E
MYPPPPPPPGRSGGTSFSSQRPKPTSSGSESSSSRLTTTTVLGTRSHPAATSPLTSTVFSHDYITGVSSSSAVPVETGHTSDDMDWVFTPPVLVKHGMFAGRSLRFALAVAQEPVLGRRKTEKDRRPLGPAPIIRFRAMERKRRRRSRGSGSASGSGSGSSTGSEEEVDPSSIEPSHLICAAELGPPADEQDIQSNTPSTSARTFHPRPISRTEPEYGSQIPTGTEYDPDGTEDQDVPMIDTMGERLEIMRSSPPTIPQGGSFVKERESNIRSGSGTPHQGEDNMVVDEPSSDDELDEDEDQPIPMMKSEFPTKKSSSRRSSARSTPKAGGSAAFSTGVRNLYGNLHVAGVRVPAPEGGMGTWFLFTDLSVRHEGTFSLRFRCFDLTAIASDEGIPAPCLVEAQSQPFRVYSPRQVPPLPKPTELAEHFAKQGFKLNTRKNERTASSPPPPAISPPPTFSDKSNKKPATVKTRERPGVKPLQESDSGRSTSGGQGGLAGGSSTGSSLTTMHDLSGESGSIVLSGSGGSSSIGLASGSAGSAGSILLNRIEEDK